MSPITSNSERGGYFSSFMFSYVNCQRVVPNSDAPFFFSLRFRFRFRCRHRLWLHRDGNLQPHDHRVLEIEWAIKNGKEFVPSPKKPRKPRGKKRKVAAINVGHGRSREEGSSMMAGQHSLSMGLSSVDEGEETERECEDVEVSLLSRIREEEYEGNTVVLETPALKRVRSDE